MRRGERGVWRVGVGALPIARNNPRAEIFAVEWPGLCWSGAKERKCAAAKVARATTRFLERCVRGGNWNRLRNLVLHYRFLHHFDPATIEKLLRKVPAALCAERPGGDRGNSSERGFALTPADAAALA